MKSKPAVQLLVDLSHFIITCGFNKFNLPTSSLFLVYRHPHPGTLRRIDKKMNRFIGVFCFSSQELPMNSLLAIDSLIISNT